MLRIAVFLFSLLIASSALAQSTLLQGGPWAPGRAPMYVGSGNGQAVVQDSGPAGGGGIGLGLAEQLLTVRGTGTAPYANAGSGPLKENWCDWDAPLTNANGGHVLCISPNAQGGGLISYNAFGIAPPLPLYFDVNGALYQFPFGGSGGILGPSTTIFGDIAVWNNTVGTLLADGGPPGVSVSLSNAGASAPPGAAVYVSASGAFSLARANAISTAGVVGLAAATIAPSASGFLVDVGVITLTTGQWDTITGQSGGLTAGALYFLDPTTAGHLTSTAPTTLGQVITLIGRAVSTTKMIVNPGTPVLL